MFPKLVRKLPLGCTSEDRSLEEKLGTMSPFKDPKLLALCSEQEISKGKLFRNKGALQCVKHQWQL